MFNFFFLKIDFGYLTRLSLFCARARHPNKYIYIYSILYVVIFTYSIYLFILIFKNDSNFLLLSLINLIFFFYWLIYLLHLKVNVKESWKEPWLSIYRHTNYTSTTTHSPIPTDIKRERKEKAPEKVYGMGALARRLHYIFVFL